jgi:hypothetical protein
MDGTGATLAWPMIRCAAALLGEVADDEEASGPVTFDSVAGRSSTTLSTTRWNASAARRCTERRAQAALGAAPAGGSSAGLHWARSPPPPPRAAGCIVDRPGWPARPPPGCGSHAAPRKARCGIAPGVGLGWAADGPIGRPGCGGRAHSTLPGHRHRRRPALAPRRRRRHCRWPVAARRQLERHRRQHRRAGRSMHPAPAPTAAPGRRRPRHRRGRRAPSCHRRQSTPRPAGGAAPARGATTPISWKRLLSAAAAAASAAATAGGGGAAPSRRDQSPPGGERRRRHHRLCAGAGAAAREVSFSPQNTAAGGHQGPDREGRPTGKHAAIMIRATFSDPADPA